MEAASTDKKKKGKAEKKPEGTTQAGSIQIPESQSAAPVTPVEETAPAPVETPAETEEVEVEVEEIEVEADEDENKEG